MKMLCKIAAFTLLLMIIPTFLFAQNSRAMKWVGSWSTAPQLVEPNNMPPAPGLTNSSIRQVVRVSIGGERVRIRFSNEFSNSPVTIKAARIALSKEGSEIISKTDKILTFSGSTSTTMDAGTILVSDPVVFPINARADVSITLYLEKTSQRVTGHPGSRTTSYIIEGNDPSVSDFSNAVTTDHWYIINGIDVMASPDAGAVAILGNSITDGRGSTTNLNNRWPDVLSERLLSNPQTRLVGVLNMGIGGNCMLSGGLGPNGISRYKRDILNQAGVKWVIIYLGVNDLGGVRNESALSSVSEKLIQAYKELIISAKSRKLKVYGATIMPFKGNGYYNPFSEKARQKVNQWIRSSGFFDAVIDFDKVLQNPHDPESMLSTFVFQNDFLHPNAEGHLLMGQFVDLNLFVKK
jgi:lysophospholipase L1-like esterase